MGLFYSLSYAVIKNNNKKTPKIYAEDTRILGDLVDFLFTHHARHVYDTRANIAFASRFPEISTSTEPRILPAKARIISA